MPRPIISPEVAIALEFKEEVETAAIQKLLLSNPERYRIILCDRAQDAAGMALALPAIFQYRIRDELKEQQQIFRMFIEFGIYSGMSIAAALGTVRTALNKFLDAVE